MHLWRIVTLDKMNFVTVTFQDAAQVFAEYAQHAGAHDVRALDEQRDRGEQIEQVNQKAFSSTAVNRS